MAFSWLRVLLILSITDSQAVDPLTLKTKLIITKVGRHFITCRDHYQIRHFFTRSLHYHWQPVKMNASFQASYITCFLLSLSSCSTGRRGFHPRLFYLIHVNLTNWRQFLCVCPVIDHKFRHHIVKVAVDAQTTLTMWWRNSLSITGQTH